MRQIKGFLQKNNQSVAEDLFYHIMLANHFRVWMLDSSSPSIVISRMLALIYTREPCSLKQLCELYGITASTGSVMIEKMVQLGYVERKQDETDRRRIIISLTDEGIREAEQTFKIQIGRLKKAISQLDEHGQNKLQSSILETKRFLEKINLDKTDIV